LAAGRRLRANIVTCVNLGLKSLAPAFRGPQWIYLPERRFRAYRIGFYDRLSAAMSPPGREAVYVEIAHAAAEDARALVAAAVADLVALGAIRDRDDVEVVAPVRIPGAYVIHDAAWATARRRVLRELEARRIFMVGRYGRWEYASIEDALAQGIDAPARALGSDRGTPRNRAS
jgi:protoporphyrinogen oxidase